MFQCDAIDPTFAKEWITDFDAFESALQSRHEYTSNLASSLALGLDEFYNNIEHVVVSAFDGFGMDDFFSKVQKSVGEYEKYVKSYFKVKRKVCHPLLNYCYLIVSFILQYLQTNV